MKLDRRGRQRLWVTCGALTLLGAGLLGFGAMAPGLSPDHDPIPLRADQTVQVPDPGPYGGRALVYGGSQPVSPDASTALGCSVHQRGFRGTGTTTRGIESEDRLVIGGQAVLPLLALTRSGDGVMLTCTGPNLARSSPLYVVLTHGVRDLVPMAAYSLAALALPLGAVGLWQLRPEPVSR